MTQLEVRKGIKSDIQGVASLRKIEDILFSSSEVYYSQPVSRFYEANVEVPVKVLNLPEGCEVELMPSVVDVCYRAVFANKHEYSKQDFNIFVDYNSLSDQLSGATKIEVGELPKGIISIFLNKYFVENYIVGKKITDSDD